MHGPTQFDHPLRAQRVQGDGRAQRLVEPDGGRGMEHDGHVRTQPLSVFGAQAQIGVGHVAADARHFAENLLRVVLGPYAIKHLCERKKNTVKIHDISAVASCLRSVRIRLGSMMNILRNRKRRLRARNTYDP